LHILLVTASLPYPPASGGAIRVYGIIKGLVEAGHKIHLMSFGDKKESPLDELCEVVEVFPTPQRSKIERLKTLLLSNQADIASRFYSEAFAQRLIALIHEKSFDLIQFEAIEAAAYLLLVRETFPQAKICFDTFNAEADLQRVIFEIDKQSSKTWPQAIYSWMQSRRIFRYEGDLCRASNLVIAVSPEDQALLSQYRGDNCTYIVPSGIFVDDYGKTHTSLDLGQNSVIFTGKMDYRPNVDAMLWFSESILPQVPQAELTIVGQKPHPHIQALAVQANIKLTGWVESVQPYLQAAAVYIAPLRMGSGTRLKLLEAMASGCAIVATSIAAAGLSERAKSALLIADTEADFAQAIQSLLKNPERRAAMGQEAQKIVRAEYDWSILIPKLLAAYQEAGLG
jgi:glycosyltransferase involved in cell wall biosynthesis